MGQNRFEPMCSRKNRDTHLYIVKLYGYLDIKNSIKGAKMTLVSDFHYAILNYKQQCFTNFRKKIVTQEFYIHWAGGMSQMVQHL
jgi:hypothetical protein